MTTRPRAHPLFLFSDESESFTFRLVERKRKGLRDQLSTHFRQLCETCPAKIGPLPSRGPVIVFMEPHCVVSKQAKKQCLNGGCLNGVCLNGGCLNGNVIGAPPLSKYPAKLHFLQVQQHWAFSKLPDLALASFSSLRCNQQMVIAKSCRCAGNRVGWRTALDRSSHDLPEICGLGPFWFSYFAPFFSHGPKRLTFYFQVPWATEGCLCCLFTAFSSGLPPWIFSLGPERAVDGAAVGAAGVGQRPRDAGDAHPGHHPGGAG